MRPIIGIPTLTFHDGDNPALNATRHTYIDSIVAAGGTPILIPLTPNSPEALRQTFELCQGLLFCGGKDINPTHYHAVKSPLCDVPDDARDSVEIQLMRWCLAENKPVLGICRGCQLMNVAAGGDLVQDIPTERSDATIHGAGFTADNQTQYSSRHHVLLSPGTKASAIFSSSRLQTNTLHHQAVKNLAAGFVQSAVSEDHITEGIESTSHRFAVGLQWHPELLWKDENPVHLKPFVALVDAARRT